MATRKVSVEEVKCDECGELYYHPKDEELPLGYYLPRGIFWVHGAGGSATYDNLFFDNKECLEAFISEVEIKMQ